MADFDPDSYLASKGTSVVDAPKGFEPDAYLKGKEPGSPANPGTGLYTPPALSAEDALRQKEAIQARTAVRKAREDFVTKNAQAGVPLDIDSGLPAGIRARLSIETDPDKQAELLAKQEGVLSTRKSKDGAVIARINGEDGKPRDVLLHPMNKRLDVGAVAGEAAPLAKMGAAGALAYATGGLSAPLQAAVIGTTMGGLDAQSKLTSRVLAGQEIDSKSLAKDAAIEGGLNAAFPLAGFAISKTAKGFQRLFQGSGALEEAVPLAAKRLGVQTLPSMDTGSKVLARAENSAGLVKQNEALAGGLKAAEDRQLGISGPAAVPPEEAIAGKVQPIIEKNALAAGAQMDTAKDAAARAAANQIEATLDAGLVPSNLPQSEAGSYLRTKLAAFAQDVKDQANKDYPAFYQAAADKGITLDPKPVSDLVKLIAKEDPSGAAELLAPSIKQVKSVESRLNPLAVEPPETGILDQFGKPTKQAAEEVPPLGFQEAINLRSIVRRKLNSPTDPLGDPFKRYYNKLDGALTETIENGIKSDESGELRKAYDTARAAYSEGAQALEQGKLPKLFANAGDPSYVPDEKLVPSLFTGQGNLDGLKAWKSVLDPKDYKLLLRQGLNHLAESSGMTGNYINAEKFLSKINGLSPEVREQLLGAVGDALTNNVKLLAAARGSKIDPVELADALAAAPGQAPKLLQEAFAREKAFDLQYNNSITKVLRGGNLGPNNLGNVDKFTSDWLSKAGAADVRQAMTQIRAASPDTAELVRQRALQNILDSSRSIPELGQVSTGGNPAIDPVKLVKFISGTERDKYQTVLGKEGIAFLDDLATISEANAKRIAHGTGKPLTAEGNAERAAAIVGGNELSLAREAGRGALNLALKIPGNAIRSQAIANYLKTGELPILGRTARTALAALPETVEQTNKIREDRSTALAR